jgi:LPXTG-motif cell wall-anchored protein
MRVPFVLVAAALSLSLITGEAFGMAWGNSRHRRGSVESGGSSFGGSGSGSGSGYNAGLPEPSSVYAIASALALLGGAGWLLRRK